MARSIEWCPNHGEYMEFGPTYACPDCEHEKEIMRGFHAKFTSGNDVPVQEARVTREEYLTICDRLGGDPIGDPEPVVAVDRSNNNGKA